MKMLLNLLLGYYYRQTVFQYLDWLVHISFGLKSVFPYMRRRPCLHDKETISSKQSSSCSAIFRTIVPFFRSWPLFPKWLYYECFWFLVGFFFFLSLEYWSNTTENWENILPPFQKFMLCDVDPRILIMNAEKLDISLEKCQYLPLKY